MTPNELTPDLAAFIEAQTSIFLATASANGQPHIQHRGPPRFLRVLDRVLDDKTPRQRRPRFAETRIEHLVLARPFGGQVGEASDTHTVRSRPSMAALTRSGARNASEIVILTLRMLHPSRFASLLVTTGAAGGGAFPLPMPNSIAPSITRLPEINDVCSCGI